MINILQFCPYFPPHKGGLETVAQELSYYYKTNNYGNIINITFDIDQNEIINKIDKKSLIYSKNNNIIGYKFDGYVVYLLPSFDIIKNFPFPKFWQKKYWNVFDEIKKYKFDYVQTHTRFFLSSFIGGLYSKKNKIKWIHIEHGSEYVKLGSKIKTFIAYLYDKTLGNWTIKNANIVIGISNACKVFIQNEFNKNDVHIIYRGIKPLNKGNNIELKKMFPNKILIGYLGRIYKWKNVHSLIKAYYMQDDEIKNITKLIIIGDGEELDNLKKLDKDNIVYFTGGVNGQKAIELQSQFDIHIHSSSPGGGLATTLLQAMELGCLIVATPNEGAQEVIIDGQNGILIKDDSINEIKNGIINAINILKTNSNQKKTFEINNKNIIQKKFRREQNIKKYNETIKNIT